MMSRVLDIDSDVFVFGKLQRSLYVTGIRDIHHVWRQIPQRTAFSTRIRIARDTGAIAVERRAAVA